MSSTTVPDARPAEISPNELWTTFRISVLKPLGSMRISVFLLSVSMFLVFVGSLAQARRDVWMVVNEYFRCWVAWVNAKDLFPPTMFPGWIDFDWSRLGWLERFPYPGGWMIGTAMCVNLLAAHVYRIRFAVKGQRLMVGLLALVGAMGITAWIITAGNATGLQSDPLLGYDGVWRVVLGSLAAIAVGSGLLTFGPFSAEGPGRILWAAVGIVSGSLFLYFLLGEDARLTNESMRILWQLIEGSIAASALLIACSLLFNKRAGIVVLHLGILMLMFSEWQVAKYGRENQMTLTEGETSTFLRDIRERELAIVERGGAREDGEEKDRVWVIPEGILKQANDSGEVIAGENLPFPIRVREFFVNSELKTRSSDTELPKAAGLGSVAMAVEQNPRTGMDELPDISSCYIDVLNDSHDSVLSTHLVSQEASELRGEFAERIQVDGRTFDLYLRSMRTYRPWTVRLLDVSRTNYIGTATPKDFRSKFVITEANGKEHEYVTWMNNPVRFGGETFYQQGYQNIPGTGEVTTLQVVKNTGWMLPYIGCMVVGFGMFAQFGQTLLRFLRRQSRPSAEVADEVMSEVAKDSGVGSNLPGWVNVLIPVIIITCMAGWILGKAVPPKTAENLPNIRAFGKLPVTSGGRTQPFETFAQNTLLSILGKTTFTGEMERDEIDEMRPEIVERLEEVWNEEDWQPLKSFSGTYPEWLAKIADVSGAKESEADAVVRDLLTVRRTATRWMLDVLCRPDVAERHRVFHITDDQLLALLNLEKRAPYFEYSASEFRGKVPELQKIYNDAHQLLVDEEAARLTPLQRRVHTLIDDDSRIRFFPEIFNGRPNNEEQSFSILVETWRLLKLLESRPATYSVPTGSDVEELAWESGVAADAIVKSQSVLERLEITDPKTAVDKILAALPREAVSETLQLTYRMLSETVRQENPTMTADELNAAVKARAASAKDAEQLSREPYLQKIMAVIADAPEGRPFEQVTSELTAEQLQELTSDRPAPGAMSVLEVLEQTKDHRSTEVRARLRKQMSSGADLNKALEREAVELVVGDLTKRAGHVLFAPDRSESILAVAHSRTQQILASWGDQNTVDFNNRTKEYQQWLSATEIPFLNEKTWIFGLIPVDKIAYESYINGFAPQFYTIFLYLTGLALAFFSWLGFRKSLWRSAMGVTVVAFVVHSFYLYARMQISGRPPVTNLYSSAVFIGWGIVLGAFIFEYISRLGLLNAIGCATGAATLCMAWFLGIDEGDTLSVMQAVLDTQFWLATHVVCVTVGYSATFLAGMLSIVYCVNYGEKRFSLISRVLLGTIGIGVLLGFAGLKNEYGFSLGGVFSLGYVWYAAVFRKSSSEESGAELLGKVIYGVICFALFFSFIGTVLGGLWADDSWGRFWGWDPKENGALLIVIWNALILHARWDKMVRNYGTAVLAIAGNIVTAWSWFGVNELGAGLHKYGFTEGRLMYLMLFALGNAVFIGLAVASRAALSRNCNRQAT